MFFCGLSCWPQTQLRTKLTTNLDSYELYLTYLLTTEQRVPAIASVYIQRWRRFRVDAVVERRAAVSDDR